MTNMDSSFAAGNEGVPNPDLSEGNVQPSSETVSVSKAEWDNVQKTLKRLEDTTRSDKDRAVKKTNERLDGLESKVQETLDRVLELMQEHGISKEEAMTVVKSQDEDIETKEALREIRQALREGILPAGLRGNAEPVGDRVAEVAKEFELDPNSPEVISIYRKYGDSDDAEKAVLRLAAKRKPDPSVSVTTALEGRPLQAPNQQELISRLEKLSINPSTNWKEIEEINKKLGW